MNPSREDIVAEARTWKGTPYMHLQRTRGGYCDCVGMIIGVARTFALGDYLAQDYEKTPDPEHMGRKLHQHLDPLEDGVWGLGDILWLRIMGKPSHLAIVGDYEAGPGYSIIHAHSTVGEVVEHRLNHKWRRRIHRAFRYRGVGF